MNFLNKLEEYGFTIPDYNGRSILNIPASTGRLMGVSGFKNPPLDEIFMEPFGDGVDNLILILIDALAFHRLEKWLAEDESLPWHSLKTGGILAPLTSICPSTTCAAITSFWTGASAAEHGTVGYEMWLKDFGITANMIEHKPINYRMPGGGLELAGFDAESFLSVPSITDLFYPGGIETHAFQHYAIIHSGLSRMFMSEAERHGIGSTSDMWIGIRELMESRQDQKKYIWAYWGGLDGISHLYGPDSERAQAEFSSFSANFRDWFLEKLHPSLKKNTGVILTADHGMISTDRDNDHYDLKNHPDFIDLLHIKPTGENRLAFLHIKPGQVEKVKEYVDQAWPDQFTLVDPDQAVQAGLFGPGTPHPDLPNRMGDLIAAARGNAYWWWSNKANPLIGRHGGLSSEEMLVPFLAARLG